MSLDIAANRRATKYSRGENLARVLWSLGQWAFRCSPRVLYPWRAFVLRVFGARIGRSVRIDPSVRIALPWRLSVGDWTAIGEHAVIYCLGAVHLGQRVTVSQRAHLCAGTHDYSRPDMPLLRPPITVEDEAWICADAFVGPQVTVAQGAVVGAAAVVTRNVEAWTVVGGNPARPIKKREMQESP